MIKISGTVLLAGCLLFTASCKKKFFSEVNNNPNAPASVIPSVLLPTVEGSLAYTQGGDMSRYASMFVQQTNGVARQSLAYYQYVLTNQDIDNLWANLYTSTMQNDDSLLISSDVKGYKVYGGIARILMAYSLQITVDFWGKIPYSQSFQGVNKLQPSYDDDKALYGTILSLCDSGIGRLNDTVPGALVPGSDDVIFGGDPAKWIQFAHAIKARIYLHQSKGSATMAASALTEIAAAMGSNADNAAYSWFNTTNSASPWFQFNQQRGDISFATSTMADTLMARNDPRLGFMIDTSGGTDNLAAYYGIETSAVEFITYDELQFMKAEATLTSGGSLAAVQAAYQSGIGASMQKLGVASGDIASYIAANGTLTSSNALSKIAYEEYVALYLNPEAWVLWRRTGFPALTATKGTDIPRRFLYPQTELSYNKANVPAGTMFSPKIFWDN